MMTRRCCEADADRMRSGWPAPRRDPRFAARRFVSTVETSPVGGPMLPNRTALVHASLLASLAFVACQATVAGAQAPATDPTTTLPLKADRVIRFTTDEG